MRSPWVGVDLAADPVAWARLLRRAHDVVLSGGGRPAVLRELVVRSWGRSAAAGVDPERPAPHMLDETMIAERLARHPLAAELPAIRAMLGDVAQDARHLMVLADHDGVLLWAEGHPRMLEAAVEPRFLPGHLCSEGAVGTNAVGTTLVLDHAVQIFSAEHYNRLLHGWTCAAAPIHDPETGLVLGVLNLSGSFRTAHPHTLSLVLAVARAIERDLAAERRRREDELSARYLDRLGQLHGARSAVVSATGHVVLASPRGWLGERIAVPPAGSPEVIPGRPDLVAEPAGAGGTIVWARAGRHARARRRRLRLEALGVDRVRLRRGEGPMRLTRRHSEIVVLLAMHGDGLGADPLARALYGADGRRVTLRAELARLRHQVGDALASEPYRLRAPVQADFLDVQRLIARGDVVGAGRRYRGPLLPSSDVPEIAAARQRLERSLQPLRNPRQNAGAPASR
jgi:hypothetical protein